MNLGEILRPQPVTLGGDDGNRTHDLLLAKQALYQLSYVPFSDPEGYLVLWLP
ncbi:MAG: hypothetical protein RL726_1526 [Actinomycetota bacterium]